LKRGPAFAPGLFIFREAQISGDRLAAAESKSTYFGPCINTYSEKPQNSPHYRSIG
jgi:hypothetical protein